MDGGRQVAELRQEQAANWVEQKKSAAYRRMQRLIETARGLRLR